MKSILLKIIAMEVVVFSLFSLTARVVLVLRSLRYVYSTCVKDRKETNPIHHLQHLFDCIVNWSTLTEIPLFILSIIYAVPVYLLDNCLCPF